MSILCAGRVEDRGLLTGGGGLAGIDVADNDHVDMHLFLTARRRHVSRSPLRSMPLLPSCCRCSMAGRGCVDVVLTHPMVAVLEVFRFVCGYWRGLNLPVEMRH